jgi:nucleoside-diphosphate-sugar epimerase
MVTGDLTETGSWQDAVHAFKPASCVHLAWQGLPDYSPEACQRNFDASVRLFDTLASAGTSRVVVAGSCWEYGNARGAISEDAVAQQPGVFASTKIDLLNQLRGRAGASGLGFGWARIFFVYGPGQRRTSLIPHVCASYAEGRPPDVRRPEAVEDFVHIDDVAAALVALTEPAVPSGVYNVGSGQPTRVADIVNRIAVLHGQAPPYPAAEGANGLWADTKRIFEATGWRARIDIADGLARTCALMNLTA